MTKVDFYILPGDTEQVRQMFICRLLNKVLGSEQTVFIRCGSQASAEQLDEFIWANKPEWFLPHQLFEPVDDTNPDAPPQAAVEIGYPTANQTETCGHHHDILINLHEGIPNYFSSFQRLIEVVNQDSKILAESRINFKFYRDRGYPIDTHNL